MRNILLAITISTTLLGAAVAPALAEGNHFGFGSESSGPNNGNSGNNNGNLDNNGTSSSETTGPKGQLKNGKTDCNNCETETDLPGKNR